MPAPFPITRVRYEPEEGRLLFAKYILAGEFQPERPPRGVDPQIVLEVLHERVDRESPRVAFLRAVESMRFYELEEVVPHLLRTLEVPIGSSEDLARCCYAVQAAADALGLHPSWDPAHVERGSRFYDEVIVEHPLASEVWPVVMETRTVLAPHGSDRALSERIARDVAAAEAKEGESEEAALIFDRLVALERNDLTRLRREEARKAQVAALPAGPERAAALVDLYLGRAYVGPAIESWAARRLRLDAYSGRAAEVQGAFANVLDAVDPAMAGTPLVDLEVDRAAKALVYVGGSLSEAHLALWERRKDTTPDFLEDA